MTWVWLDGGAWQGGLSKKKSKILFKKKKIYKARANHDVGVEGAWLGGGAWQDGLRKENLF